MKTGAIITAAGLSSRMGKFKPMLEIGSMSMIKRLIAAFREADASPIVVVTGHNAEGLEEHLAGENVVFLRNEAFATTQMLESAKIGLEYITDKCERTFFTPVDVPLFSRATLRALLASDAMLTKPCYGGKEGHPILLNCGLIPAILRFEGEGGLRAALDAFAGDTRLLELDDEGILFDADTPGEFARLTAYHAAKRTSGRTLYLIRHAHTENQGSRCISRTDLSLSGIGMEQAASLRDWVKNLPVSAIYSSPLRRCIETARIMAGGKLPVQIVDDLREMDVGEWENLTFDEIRARYPQAYAARGERPGTTTPPGGESFIDAGARLVACLDRLLAQSEGDIAVVAHAGVNRGALCRLMNLSPDDVLSITQPHGCVNILRQKENGGFDVISFGEKPNRWPDALERQYLLNKCETSPEAIAHGQAVAKAAEGLAAQIAVPIDAELLHAACLLHDMLRHEPGHAEMAAELLRLEGYPLLADTVGQHHDLSENSHIETELLYLADKLVIGTQRVVLEERFAKSAEKLSGPEAKEAWMRRLNDARKISWRYGLGC